MILEEFILGGIYKKRNIPSMLFFLLVFFWWCMVFNYFWWFAIFKTFWRMVLMLMLMLMLVLVLVLVIISHIWLLMLWNHKMLLLLLLLLLWRKKVFLHVSMCIHSTIDLIHHNRVIWVLIIYWLLRMHWWHVLMRRKLLWDVIGILTR